MVRLQRSSFIPKWVANLILALCITGFLVYNKLIWQNRSMVFIAMAIFFSSVQLEICDYRHSIHFEAILCTLRAVHWG